MGNPLNTAAGFPESWAYLGSALPTFSPSSDLTLPTLLVSSDLGILPSGGPLLYPPKYQFAGSNAI